MQTKTLFLMEDTFLGQCGLYAMWTTLYITNLIVLCEDDTKGPSRDFNVIANGLSVLYCGVSGANMIFGNKLPSSMMLTVGPIHQYLFWLLFAYYGGDAVLGTHPIGVYNWVTLFVVGMFTVDMVIKTWFLSLDPTKYREYMLDKSGQRPAEVLEEVAVNDEQCQNVVAKFTFKEGKFEEFKTMLDDPEKGLNLTKSSEGYISIDALVDQDEPNVLVLVQKWKTKQNHLDYLQKRTDMGMFDQLKQMVEVEPEIRYVEKVH